MSASHSALIRSPRKVPSPSSPGGAAPTIHKRSLDPKTVGDEIASKMRNYVVQHEARLRSPLALADIDVGLGLDP
jgi:hypothetical protein